jgi:HPt (histidine-containing phosphotransfer) domain-containing protein
MAGDSCSSGDEESQATATRPRKLVPALDTVVVDQLKQLASRAENNELLAQLHHRFRDQTSSVVAALRSARLPADLDEVLKSAHAMKSMCSVIGATAASAAASEIMVCDTSFRNEDFQGLISDLERSIALFDDLFQKAAAIH